MKIKTTAGILAAFAVMTLGACPGNEDTPEEPQGLSGPTEETSRATGGKTTFVLTGTDTWDEVHTFHYSASLDSGSGAAYELKFRNGAPAADIEAHLLIVAGGGAGGNGTVATDWAGGGGAGGVIYYGPETPTGYTPHGSFYRLSNANYDVTVGNGGAGVINAHGENGKNSVFAALTATGGGGGGGNAQKNGSLGGSGGGAWGTANGGAGTDTQGNNGGAGAARGCGGGGAGSAAPDNKTGSNAGNGGAGIMLSISDPEAGYAGGGASGAYVGETYFGSTTAGYMGTATHGGGSTGNPGTDGTGGGGSGASGLAHPAQKGGDGIVIVRFPWTAPTEGEQKER